MSKLVLPPMKPEVTLVLAKMLTDTVISNARDLAGDGVAYDVEATIHVRGLLSIGEATMTKQVNKLNPIVLLQLALSKLNGVTIESFVKEALEMQKRIASEDKEPAEMVEFKEKVSEAMDKLTAGLKQRRRGGVSFEGEVILAGERVTVGAAENE